VDALVNQELNKLGWKGETLGQEHKGDRRKLQIALHLRRQTTMTFSWISQRLQMGTKTYLAHLLYWQGRKKS